LLAPDARARVRLVIVGHDTRWRPRPDLASVAERATFLPPVKDIERLYHALDVVVHPAPFEEFGMTVLEAMACGLPVVTSAAVGAAELLRRVDPERVLPAPDPHAIARTLEPLVLDPSERARASAASLAASRDHAWDANFAATRRCLETVRGAAPTPVGA
jgi:glycosyltransferase involved in cell wall biosynthesis